MKKILSAALAALMALSLTACSGNSSSGSSAREFTSAELSQILSTAISEHSESGAEVITADSLSAATDWLTENKGMSADEAAAFMDEYEVLPYEDIEATLTEKGFTADEITAFQSAESSARSAQMIFDTLGLSASDLDAGALSISLINIRAYGMAILKPAEGKEDTVLSACQSFVELQQKNFETYLQDQYAIAKNAKCETVNGYVVMVMGDGSDDVFQAVSDALNAQ